MDLSGRIPADVVTSDEVHRARDVGGRAEVGSAHPLLARRWAGLPVLHERGSSNDDLSLNDVALGIADATAIADKAGSHEGGHPASGFEQIGGQPGGQKAGHAVFRLEGPRSQTDDGRAVEGVLSPAAEREFCRLEGACAISDEMRESHDHAGILAQAAPGTPPPDQYP